MLLCSACRVWSFHQTFYSWVKKEAKIRCRQSIQIVSKPKYRNKCIENKETHNRNRSISFIKNRITVFLRHLPFIKDIISAQRLNPYSPKLSSYLSSVVCGMIDNMK